MGLYGERVLPRIVNVACGTKSVAPLRRRVCEALAGDVVEIGFGSGLNVAFYPAAVTRVAAVEPAEVGWRLAGKRLRATSIPVQWSGLDGQSLPFPDDSYDAALSTWTLCTIPDVAAALQELRRVLRPGGTLHFVEHGLARRAGPPLATTPRAGAEASLRRMPPDPAGRRPADNRRLHHHRARRLLREGRPKGRRRRLPRHRPVSLRDPQEKRTRKRAPGDPANGAARVRVLSRG